LRNSASRQISPGAAEGATCSGTSELISGSMRSILSPSTKPAER
jgi:hypothetical protein